MKKIFSVALLAAGVAAFSSCSDFLDQDAKSEIKTTGVYNSAYYTSLRVNKIYGGLTQDRTYSQDLAIVWNLNSDIELVDGLGDDATNTGSERGNMNYNMSPGWSKISGVWDAIYGVIEDANDCIDGINNSDLLANGTASDKAEMQRYLGEALTLRALCYFDLVRFFGDVPFKTEHSKSDLSNAYLHKTDRDEIMDQLMNDLDQAIEYLPWADAVGGYTTEHVTKGYAHGLLAQIALTRAGYAIREQAKEGYETADYTDETYPTQRPDASKREELYKRALTHLSAIITNGTHKLNPSFEKEWDMVNKLTLDKTYHENIFEIPMGRNVTGELGYTVGVRLNGVTTEYGYGNSTGKLKLTAPLLYSYDDKDERRDVTVAAYEIKQDGKKTIESMLGNAPFGLYCAKWDPRRMTNDWLQENLKATAKHMTGINPVVMRYSQILLWYAEVMNELVGAEGRTDGDAGITAKEALAEVHTRAFSNDPALAAWYMNNKVPTDKEGFFNAIVQENAWEFAGEGFRKWDLIRWNLLAQKIQEFKDTYVAALDKKSYPETLYFNYSDEAETKIDLSSITWHGLSDDMTEDDYKGKCDGFGKSKTGTGKDKNVDTNLPTISSGLVGDGVQVKNRYLMPIASTTISASNGYLENSYGFGN